MKKRPHSGSEWVLLRKSRVCCPFYCTGMGVSWFLQEGIGRIRRKKRRCLRKKRADAAVRLDISGAAAYSENQKKPIQQETT